MQENNKLWLEIKEMFETSQTEVTIFNGAGSDSAKICDMLRVTSASAMGAVMLNTSGVVFDDWIRLYGGDTSDMVGISKINLLSKNGTPERVKQMLIVATDVVGGIFAINSGKFDEGIGDVWYFAPDTLDWEDLELRYSEFIAWLAQGNIDEFYSSMRWTNWRESAKNVEFDKSILIYPFLWSEEVNIETASQTEVTIFNGAGSDSAKICDMLRVTSASAMGAVMLNTSGVVFDDWIRLYGGDTSDMVGISKINLLSKNGTPERVKQMLIVATDVVGGIFAINSGKFDEGIGDVWYFAPDTLDWEDLELRYSEFIAWLAQGNIDEFYSSMRWTNWRESAKNVEFDKSILIYPFLWSEEVNIETASKSIVPFDELFATNMEYREKFGIGD